MNPSSGATPWPGTRTPPVGPSGPISTYPVLGNLVGPTTLKTIALDVRQRLAPFRSSRFFQRDRIKTSLQEHEEILQAIFAQDPERAASAMRLHTTRTAINVMNQLAAEADVQHVEMPAGKRNAVTNARRSRTPKLRCAR